MKRLIIGISGASGAIYGVRMLQVLRDVPDIETHLILSQAARQTLAMETDLTVREVQALADVVQHPRFATACGLLLEAQTQRKRGLKVREKRDVKQVFGRMRSWFEKNF